MGDVFRQELRPWGISVSIVEPGSIDTPIWERGEREADEIGERAHSDQEALYGKAIAGYRKVVKNLAERGIPPEKVAEVDRARAERAPAAHPLPGRPRRQDPGAAEDRPPDPPLRPHDRPRDGYLAMRAWTLRSLLYWRRRLTGQSTSRQSPGDREERVARSGRTAQLDEREGPEPRGGRAARARRRGRRRRAGRAAGEVEPAGGGRGAAGRRRAARRPEPDRRPRLGARAGHPPARRQHLRARAREGLQHLGPDRPRRGGPRRLPQDPHVRRRRRRGRLPRVRARGAGRRDRHRAARRAARRPHRLLRPALSRAVPDPRRARRPPDHRAVGVHRWPPAATTGRSCCGRGRSRTRSSSSPPTRSARRRRTSAPTGTR